MTSKQIIALGKKLHTTVIGLARRTFQDFPREAGVIVSLECVSECACVCLGVWAWYHSQN